MKRSEMKPWAWEMTCEELAKQCEGECPINSGKIIGCPFIEQVRCKPTTRGAVLMAAHDVINGERQDQYGSAEDNFQRIAGYWSLYKGTPFSRHDVAMMMALLKIARIQSGSGKTDSYTDLCGYAALAADMKEKEHD